MIILETGRMVIYCLKLTAKEFNVLNRLKLFNFEVYICIISADIV